MMSISAEPSLVDQHSAVACSPAEPLWNQASASLSEKKNHSILVSSQKLTGSILYLQNERQVLKNNFWSFGLASSQGLEQRLCCNAQRIERIHRNHTPDVDHGQPQFLQVVFYFSVFLSCVFSLDKGGHHNYIMNEANRRSLENPPALKTNWGELMLWFGDYILHSGDAVPKKYQSCRTGIFSLSDGWLAEKLCSPVRR